MSRGLGALVVGGAVVIGAVVALAALVLPDPTQTLVAAGPVDATAPLPPATAPAGPPTQIGGVIEVTGDNPGTVDMRSGYYRAYDFDVFSSDEFVVGGDHDTFTLGLDPDAGWYLDGAVYDGLNIFLDPGECPMTMVEDNEESGVARFAFTCPDVQNAQGTATIALEATLDLPRRLGYPDGRYDSGGTLRVSGDISGEMVFDWAEWSYSEPGFTDEFGNELWSGLSLEETESLDGGIIRTLARVTIDRDDAGAPLVMFVEYGEYRFTDTDSCTVTTELIAMVAPLTELTAFEIDCPSLTGAPLNADGTTDGGSAVSVAVAGTVNVGVVTGMPPP